MLRRARSCISKRIAQLRQHKRLVSSSWHTQGTQQMTAMQQRNLIQQIDWTNGLCKANTTNTLAVRVFRFSVLPAIEAIKWQQYPASGRDPAIPIARTARP